MKASWGFRAGVALHVIALYVMMFAMRSALSGAWHLVAAVALTLLISLIAFLFIADMTGSQSNLSKAIDAFVGLGWSALVGFLISNSWRAGL